MLNILFSSERYEGDIIHCTFEDLVRTNDKLLKFQSEGNLVEKPDRMKRDQ